MASRNIGGIYASLYLKDEQFQKGVKSATSSLKDFAKGAGMVAAGNLLASAVERIGAGVLTLGMHLGQGVKNTLAQTDKLVDMSNQTGIAISDMMLLGRAYKDGGRDAELAATDIGKMQKAIVAAAGEKEDPFAVMGLSARELLTMGPAEQMRKIGAAIMAIQNPAERTAAALKVFGKGGIGMMTVFPGIEESVKLMGRMPELAQKYGAAMGEASDAMERLPLKSEQFFMGFTAGIIGELLPALKQIDGYDFTSMGERLGLTIATAFETLTDGTLWEIFQNKGDIAILKVAGNLENLFKQGLYAAYENTIGLPSAIINGKELMRSPGQAWDYAMGAANPFQASIDALQSSSDVQWNLKSKQRDAKLAALANQPGDARKKFNGRALEPEPEPELKYPRELKLPVERDLKQKRDPWESSNYDTNAYQKRGLGLSGMGTITTKEDKKIELLSTIRDILKKAQTDGELRWAT